MVDLSLGKMFGRKPAATASSAPSVPGNAGTILAEIGSAPQQRRLTAKIGDSEIVMDVGNRELLRVISVKPDTIMHADATEIIARDDDELPAQLEKLGNFLATLTFLMGDFSLDSGPAPLRYSSKLQGFSTDELGLSTVIAIDKGTARRTPAAAPVSSPPVAAPPPPVMVDETIDPHVMATVDTRMFDLLAPHSDAGLIMDFDGRVLRRLGNAELLADLPDSLVKDMQTWLWTTQTTLGKRQIVTLRGAGTSDPSICIVINHPTLSVLVLPGSSIGRLFIAADSLGF